MAQEKLEDHVARMVYNETQGAVVEPAYDEAGDITHFVARLSPTSFRALYPNGLISAVFLQGYWLQLALNMEEDWYVVLRDTGDKMYFRAMQTEDGSTLSFHREGQDLYQTTYEGVSLELLLGSEDGLLLIVQEAFTVFQGLPHILFPKRIDASGSVSVHIVPEDVYNFVLPMDDDESNEG